MTFLRRVLPLSFALTFLLAAASSAATSWQESGDEAAAVEEAVAGAAEGEPKAEENWQDQIDAIFKNVNGLIAGGYDEKTGENAIGFFYGVPIPGTTKRDAEGTAVLVPATGEEQPIRVPFTVLWLALGAIFFTLRMGFINFRAFKHAIDCVRGKYDDPNDEGEVTSFQALSAALSATVGLGNIASVTVAVCAGGPGAIFWLILAGVLGMSSKFTECSLGQMYREIRPNGQIMGGAMYYLSRGLKEKGSGLGVLGMILAVMFAVLCVGGSFAGGNAFQVKQSLLAVQQKIPFFADQPWAYGLMMTAAVGIVIIGGIKRIASTAEKIVPAMCGIYILACLAVIFMNIGKVPAAFGLIFEEAFKWNSLYGGMIGVLVLGFKRAAFSNEAGIGSAAIAHSAAKTPHPAREGIVALLEPFIDTVIVCTLTGLVIVITGAYDRGNPIYADAIANDQGAKITSLAFESAISWFPWVLSVAVMLFAYSTMISWSYYGERCWTWLFGESSSIFYKLIFLVFVFLGSIVSATQVLEFGDLMILGMALPNVLGVLLLSGNVKRSLNDYMTKLSNGEFKTFK